MTARDLFGVIPKEKAKDTTPVSLRLVLDEKGSTGLAWLLRAPVRGQAPKFAPRSLVTRGEGPEADLFTMPKWLARDRGWL